MAASPQVHEGDFFWDKNARQQWPSVAEDQSKQLAEYREAIAEINRTTGAGINPDAVADDMQQVRWLTSLSLHRVLKHIGVRRADASLWCGGCPCVAPFLAADLQLLTILYLAGNSFM
jgi:hypothetical protein